MLISVVLLCTAVAFGSAWLWCRGRRARALFKGLPTYPQIPILGNLYKFYGGGEALFRKIDELSRISDKENLPFVLWLGPCPLVIFMDPDDVKVMTNTFVEKPYYYNFARVWLGNGLVTAPASIWKRSIKWLGGAFPSNIVDGYQGVFDSQAQKLVAKLRGNVGIPPFDISHDLAQITLETICQTALGAPGVSESMVTHEYYVAFSQTLQLLLDRVLNPLLHFDAVYRLTPPYRKIKKCVAVLQNVSKTITGRYLNRSAQTFSVISKIVSRNPGDLGLRKPRDSYRLNSIHDLYRGFVNAASSSFITKSLLKDKQNGTTKGGVTVKMEGHLKTIRYNKSSITIEYILIMETSSSTKFKSYLDIILEMSTKEPTFTAEQIQAEVDTIIVGGQETNATNLFFILLLLGCNEQVQEKLYAELLEIFGDSDRPVEKEDLCRMRYCEAVILETLRLYPAVPMVMRYADKDLQLKSCLVPKGAACGVNVLGAGRSERAWGRDARQFRPERWLRADLDASSFLAFSYGRRACIGKKYAIALSKTVIANCIRNFRFTSEAANMTLRIELGLRPASGHLIQVFARNPPVQTSA